MKLLLATGALLALQTPINGTQQITRLVPNHPLITELDGGHLVQLNNAPVAVFLPLPVPTSASAGARPWFVDVVNYGPKDVTLKAGQAPVVTLRPKQKVHVVARGASYIVQK